MDSKQPATHAAVQPLPPGIVEAGNTTGLGGVSHSRPILFSAPMVRALLRDVDPKTQTRRILKMPTQYAFREMRGDRAIFDLIGKPPLIPNPYPPSNARMKRIRALWVPSCGADCPYGAPGDELWVKETWRTSKEWDRLAPSALPIANEMMVSPYIAYEADGPSKELHGKVRPSIFMPRWASRLTLEIESVRVERLQEISAKDCFAEGIERPKQPTFGSEVCIRDNARNAYRELWESINGKGSWAKSPWVWVVTFRRLEASR